MTASEYSLLDLIQRLQFVAKEGGTWQKKTRKKREELFLDYVSCLEAKTQELESLLQTSGSAPWAAEQEVQQTLVRLRQWAEGVQAGGPQGLAHGKVLVALSGASVFYKLACHIGAILLSGNFGFIRVPEEGAAVILLLQNTLEEVSCPEAAVHLFAGGAHNELMESLSHPALQMVFFEGSKDECVSVRRACLQSEKRAFVQAVSRNPLILGRNLDFATHGNALMKVLYSEDLHGEWRGTRVFVPENQWEPTLESLRSLVATESQSGFFSSMVENPQGATAQEAWGRIQSQGLSVEALGGPGGAAWVPEVTNCSSLQYELLSGPIVTLTRYKNSAEAIKFCNTTPWGHCAYVFDNDVEKAKKWGAQLHFGQVFCNQFVEDPYGMSLVRQGFASGSSSFQDLLSLYGRSQVLTAPSH